MFTYRKATINDVKAITDMAIVLYDSLAEEYDIEYKANAESLENPCESTWLCCDGDIQVAFAQVSLRTDYVEGTSGGTIGYLEAIYVKPEYRKNNVARELVSVCEAWAREQGCVEFASDCLLENTDSYNFHMKVGFTEANRIICFTKKL
jgi:aminoglycoside 6'-N-acetyltransferase I